jgi:diacylglycerol O-acyltransferase / trehalose O-mycolyltransferase
VVATVRSTARTLIAVAVTALGALLVTAPTPARAQQLITWTINSRYVDPARAQFNSPPPGVGARPAALRVNVLLPDGYDGKRQFPVLYLLHGHGDAYDYWVNPQRGDLLDIAKGFPGIIVMPEAATGWYTNWWDEGARGRDGRAWERYFLEEVVPLVQSRLRILPGRSNHAIAGLSMGGEGAIYFAEQLPGYFGSAASFSGTLSIQRAEWPTGFNTQGQNYMDVYGDPQAQQFYWTGHNPTALAAALQFTRVFVRVGNGLALPLFPGEESNYFGAIAEAELAQHANDFVTLARSVGVNVTYEPTTGVHDWPYWRLALESALRWGFFRNVVESPPGWTYKTVAQSGRAWDVAYSFAAPPTTLETFVRDGDRLQGFGSGAVTVVADGRPPFTAALPFDRLLPGPIHPATNSSHGQTMCPRTLPGVRDRRNLDRHRQRRGGSSRVRKHPHVSRRHGLGRRSDASRRPRLCRGARTGARVHRLPGDQARR